MKATIFDIERNSFVDGPGIRTTVFFKGCPLKCVWCHNPESIASKPQLAVYKNKCTLCGSCMHSCPSSAHIITEADQKLYGREISVSELLPVLLEDRDFYENSGGGVTLSGGECLMQADFCAVLLKSLKAEGIHTAVDTSGSILNEELINAADLVILDIKMTNEKDYKKYTGGSFKKTLEFLKLCEKYNKDVWIRQVIVPGINDNEENITCLADIIKEKSFIKKVELLPFKKLCSAKYQNLGIRFKFEDYPEADKECIEKLTTLLK